MSDLADIRRDFAAEELLESAMAADPVQQFAKWMNDVLKANVLDPNAMTISTVGLDNKPTARVVLLKDFDENGFVFFTNYGSKKAADLAVNPNTVMSFFWPQLSRQVMIHGRVEKTSREESEEYFNSRPVDSRLAAWASAQSSEIASREYLEQRFAKFREKFGDNVPLPSFWGGYRLTPDRFEFWQGRQNRLHDRICYERSGVDWSMVRLSP